MSRSARRGRAPQFLPSLLGPESTKKARKIYGTLARELNFNGFIEHMYMKEHAIMWAEIPDWRQKKYAILRAACERALLKILRHLQETYGAMVPELDEPLPVLVLDYFKGGPLKQQVLKIFETFGLDESAIEAQAFKEEMPVVEAIDRIIASLETRRDRTMPYLAGYRESFADRSKQPITATLEGTTVVSAANHKPADKER